MLELTEEKIKMLMQLLKMMEIPEEKAVEIAVAIETQKELNRFIDKLSEKNYEMTPEEVYEAMVEAVGDIQLEEAGLL